MSRGVAIPEDPIIQYRLIRGIEAELEREQIRTMLLVKAITIAPYLGNKDSHALTSELNDLVGVYRECIWPTGKNHEELIERNKEKLQEYLEQEIHVKKTQTA